MSDKLPPFREHLHRVQQVMLRTFSIGPTRAPTALVLHGYPEGWSAGRTLIRHLLDAGYRVVLPDQRGFGGSSKPTGVGAYAPDVLADDAEALLDVLDSERAVVIGHDLGGAVGVWLAARHPTRVSHVVAISAPHPAVRKITSPATGPAWVVRGLPLPGHLACQLRAWALRRAMLASTREGALSDGDLSTYREGWVREGAIDAVGQWFRAMRTASPPGRISVPTLFVVGERDAGMAGLSQASATLCDAGRVATIADAGHFPHIDAPEAVAGEIVAFAGARQPIHERTRPPRW
jgi:pimeloyl-ACP methyl ester carboxylesterase